jgi:hypothetical protein
MYRENSCCLRLAIERTTWKGSHGYHGHPWRVSLGLDPVWTQLSRPYGLTARKFLSSLVGPPGFEPGTSCTPSKGRVSISFMCSLVSNSLDEFGDIASASSKSLRDGFIHGSFTIAQSSGTLAVQLQLATVTGQRSETFRSSAPSLFRGLCKSHKSSYLQSEDLRLPTWPECGMLGTGEDSPRMDSGQRDDYQRTERHPNPLLSCTPPPVKFS